MIQIQNDLFDIVARLQSINPCYQVYYNTRLARFEVHNSSQRGNTLCFVVPYDRLDARTVQYARQTSVARAEQLLQEMEKHNAKLQKGQIDAAVQRGLGQILQ